MRKRPTGDKSARWLRTRTAFIFLVLATLTFDIWPSHVAMAATPSELVQLAREAARKDQNETSADLFRRALEADPALRGSILREYADQLTYSGQAAVAVPMYREILDSQPAADEARRAERGLALALQWSGQAAAAAEAWQKVIASDPGDEDARQNLRKILIEEANAAARQNQNARAAELLGRAIGLDPARQGELTLDYAEQLTYAGQAGKAVGLFQEVLSQNPSAGVTKRAQRGLALALLWSGKSNEAVDAWQKVIDAAPDDTDARNNLRAVLVSEALSAAEANQNARAAELLGRAIDLDETKRGELLLDYAEQLTYSGQAAKAVPLFREVLSATPSGDRGKRAQRGLALALLWSGESAEAAQEWQKIADSAPEDSDARKNLRLALIAEARNAATQNQNQRAAELFRRAMELDSGRKDELLLDYAEQLTYAGQAAMAVPLFRNILSQKPSGDDEQRAQRGLALALLWSGKSNEAAQAWQKIVDATPDDGDARKNLREAIVAEARLAASQNQNQRSADLFARAIALDPARRNELLREYAEQLSYSERSSEAVPLFRKVLASGTLNRIDTARARRGLALALLWSGANSEAIAAWEGILRSAPNDRDARKNLTDALVAAARSAASKDRNKESAALFARAIATSPSRRLELAVEYANQLTYSGRAAKAVPIYREALGAGRLKRDQRLQALLGLGLALSWSDQLKEALSIYDATIRAYPESAEAYIGRGRVLTQLDDNRKALVAFDKATTLSPQNRDAIRGAAQALSYLGRQRLSLARLAPIMGPGAEPQTQYLAARAEYWKGRPDKALAIIRELIDSHPEYSEAQKMRSEIEFGLRPLSTLDVFASTQNDGLVITGTTLRHGITTNEGLTTLGGQARSLVFLPRKGDDIFIEGLGFFGRNRFNDMLELNGSVFLNTLNSRNFAHVEPTGDVWLTLWPNDFLRFDFSGSRSYFDDVKSLSKNILIDSVGASVDYYPDPDLRLTGRTSYGWITDGNERFFGQLEAEQRVFKRPDVYLGARFTNFDFAKPYLDNGYFNPDWLYSIVGTAKIFRQITDPWNAALFGTLGREWQKDAEKTIWSAGFTTSYSPQPNLNLNFEIHHEDSPDVGGSSAFRRTTISGGLQYRW